MTVCTGDKIAVWFSCGAASAVAAKKTLEKYGDICAVRVVNNPVAEEHPDNQRFLKDVEKWLGVEIETAINPRFPSCSAVDVWAQRKYMGGIAGAPCTFELKKAARQLWESENHVDWTVLGFTADEQDRSDRFQMTERKSLLPVLIDERVTKKDCFRILFAAGIEIPEIYKLGYPNANCIGCIKATSPTYWNHVRRMHPEVFEQRAKQSREIGAKLVRVENRRIFLDELDPLATGAAMDGMSFECGSFCEERTLFDSQVDFSCRVCGKQCDSAPAAPERAVCEEHCEDHEYEYDRMERDKFCKHCGKRIDPDWYQD